jgi:response regulator of citrate/malate metabolism
MKPNEFPAGWDEKAIREIVDHYEAQTDEEAAAEHEAALGALRTSVRRPKANTLSALLDKITDELRNAPALSDEAVSRAGIYADHP